MKIQIPVFSLTRVELETDQGHKLGGFNIAFNPKTNEVRFELDFKTRYVELEVRSNKD